MSFKLSTAVKSASILFSISPLGPTIQHLSRKLDTVPRICTMATAARVELTPETTGVYHTPGITAEAAKVGSELLQKNHDNNHIFFNRSGFHNHIAHHLLTTFALGATPQQLQHAFDNNIGYQRPQYPVDTRNVQIMTDRSKFKEFLGKEQYFHDYEIFFRKEIEAKGWQAVLNEHLFAGDEHAESLLTRMYAGFYHPIIHLGFGVEFEQPAIIVEALAQAAIHDNWTAKFLYDAENKAKEGKTPSKSMVQLLKDCRANQKIKNSPHFDDPNKVRDGVLVRAPNEMIELCSQWRVSPDEIEKKTAEMINGNAWFAGAAQMPPKQVKFDFFYIHCLNCSIFFDSFLKQKWLSDENKCRLLEWKGRFDLALYVSRGSPELRQDEITQYEPKHKDDGWHEIIKRIDAVEDDGHASKLVRALAHGEVFCKNFESQYKEEFPVQGDMWLKLGHMAIDSVEGEHPEGRWVRNCGFSESWENVPERARL